MDGSVRLARSLLIAGCRDEATLVFESRLLLCVHQFCEVKAVVSTSYSQSAEVRLWRCHE